MKDTFTNEQEEQLEKITNASYNAMCEVLGYQPDWDIAWISEICETLAGVAERYFGKTEMEVYPYHDEE